MRQQINLLTEELRPIKEVFSLAQLVILMGIFVSLLVLVSAFQGIKVWQIQTNQSNTSRSLLELQAINAEMQSRKLATADPQLARRVFDLTGERDEERLLQRALMKFDTANGFADFLSDVADHREAGMWLTRITISDGGARIRLEGQTESAEYLPKFLKGLSRGSKFQGHQFDTFELEVQENGILQFLIFGPEEV